MALINGLKQKPVPVESIEAIDGDVGSRAYDMTLRNYGKAYPSETLLEALMKLDYGVRPVAYQILSVKINPLGLLTFLLRR